MINTEGYDFVINQIVDAYQKIMNKEFTKGCNDKECQWCNFNKYYLNKNEYTSEHLLNDYSDEMEER